MADPSSTSTHHPSTHDTNLSHVTISLNHPRLLALDPESIRIFLRNYDSYSRTITARAKQMSAADTTAEVVTPVDLKFCVDAQLLTSTIALGFIPEVENYDALTDKALRTYLDGEAKESRVSINLSSLDEIVSRELRMNMSNRNARSRMQQLFVQYHTLLSTHGLIWIVTDNQKLAVGHVLSAVKPTALKERLESDLGFSQHQLKKDFKAFMAHAVKLSEAFQLVDSGRQRKRQQHANGQNSTRQSSPSESNSNTTKSEVPLCLWPPHSSKGIRHLLKHCRDCPADEKKRLLQERSKKLAETGPHSNLRPRQAQTSSSSKTPAASSSETSQKHPTTGRVSSCVSSPSCDISLCDANSQIICKGRCDDGSDDTIISPRIATDAVGRGIGKMYPISPVTVQVALKEDKNAQTFQFSRSLVIPRVILHLSAGQLALLNVSFLVADDDLADEDLLLGHPLLAHLGVDSRSILEHNYQVLHEMDCSTVPSLSTQKSTIGRLMAARIEHVKGNSPPLLPATRLRSHYFANRHEPDPFPDPSLIDAADSDQSSGIDDAIQNMLQDALDNGFPTTHYSKLCEMIRSRRNVFRIGFSAGPPASVPPLRIHLKPDAVPTVMKLRRYTESQKKFLKRLIDKLLECDYIYPNPHAKWACAPHLVPKDGPGEWRFTGDLRPVNYWTIPSSYPMPVVEQELAKALGSKFFGDFDMPHSFWQFLIHPDDQETQSIITPFGIFTSRRLLHGHVNANSHLQSSISNEMSDHLKNRMLMWVDDMVIPGKDIDQFLEDLTEFLDLCVRLNIKLHPLKCHLYRRKIIWCGRELSEDGIRFDPRHLNTLEQMTSPSSPAELLHFTSAMQWMRHSIPRFSTIIRPLLHALERAYTKAGRRTKAGLRRVTMEQINWTSTEEQAFIECKKALIQRITLAHRDPTKRLSFYTDASDSNWSAIVTQVPMSDIHLPHQDKHHEPLAFLSGHFNPTQKRWSTIEKEAFAIMMCTEKMHWLASEPTGFDLYTDHNNLIFLFDPQAIQPDLSQTAIRKVLRWAVRLSAYNYVCIHIKGSENVWADLLSRWATLSNNTIRRLVTVPQLPSTSENEFEWPTSEEILKVQSASSRPLHLKHTDGLWLTSSGQTWIPDNADELQLRLCIIAHTGAPGHRGIEAKTKSLADKFYWTTLSNDVQLFFKSCIHCLSPTGGTKIPRPFGPSFYGTFPNELLQFDYIDLGPSSTSDKYVFMLRDDLSGYCWFYPTPSTSAEQASHALIDWCAAFGAPKSFMSDSPTHFKNSTLNLLCKGLRTRHHFTLPYAPWSNGAIERLGKELLRSCRAILSELQLPLNTWPDILPIIQSALNHSPSPQRKDLSPIEIFTGLKPSPPI